MASYNNIQLLGNIGSVEVKTFQNGGKIVEISLATTERWKDRNGELREETQWHKLVIGGPGADTVEKYAHKGDPFFVTEAKMTYRKYEDRDGNTRSVPEVRVKNFQLMGKKGDSQQTAAPAPQAPDPALVSAGLVDNPDGDLPF